MDLQGVQVRGSNGELSREPKAAFTTSELQESFSRIHFVFPFKETFYHGKRKPLPRMVSTDLQILCF